MGSNIASSPRIRQITTRRAQKIIQTLPEHVTAPLCNTGMSGGPKHGSVLKGASALLSALLAIFALGARRRMFVFTLRVVTPFRVVATGLCRFRHVCRLCQFTTSSVSIFISRILWCQFYYMKMKKYLFLNGLIFIYNMSKTELFCSKKL